MHHDVGKLLLFGSIAGSEIGQFEKRLLVLGHRDSPNGKRIMKDSNDSNIYSVQS